MPLPLLAQLRADIGCVIVAILKPETEISIQECDTQLINKFFTRVAFVAEKLASKIAAKVL